MDCSDIQLLGYEIVLMFYIQS